MSHTLFTKHPRTAHRSTIKHMLPAPTHTKSWPFDEGFLTVSSGTLACTQQPIYWALMLPFPVQFPSWHHWWTGSFPSSSPARGHFNSLTPPVWLHQSLNLNFLPARTAPIRDLSSSDRILISNVPNDCLSLAMGLSSEHWNTAKMPTLQPGQEDVSGLSSPLLSHSLVYTIAEKWACRSFFFLGGEGGDGPLGDEAESSQHMRGKHLASVLHPGQQESKQSITCRGRPPRHSSTQSLVGVFCHYGQQHCDVVWLSSWTENNRVLLAEMF